MKILQTISGFGTHSGGTSTCTYDLIASMQRQGEDVDLLTLMSKESTDKLMGQGEEWIHALDNDAMSPYGYSASIKKWLEREAENYDVFHTNGLWMHCNHITCAVARQRGKPYVITPHGMLYPAALRRSYWKKWPLLKLCFEHDIRKASCLHVTCRQEMEYVRAFGYRGPVAIIPNPMVMPTLSTMGRSPEARRAFGFLGRLHPIKKLRTFFYADVLLADRKRECKLWIMGGGQPEYEDFLRKEVERLGLENVKFLGFVNGQEKYERLAQLSALFVPSDFENFGMIVTEALAVGTPVMASLGTPWELLNEERCGWWLDRSSENIAGVMRQVLDMPQGELDGMGERGKEMVRRRFAAEQVAAMMVRLYRWIAEGGERPEFVLGE